MNLFSNFKKTLIVIPTVLLSQSLALISDKRPDVLVSEQFAGYVMGSITYPDSKFFVFALENLIYIFLFEILFGHYIYNDLRYSSTYIFSRISSKSKWFLEKTFHLLTYSIIYILLYLSLILILSIYSTGNFPDKNIVPIFIQIFIKLTTICFIGTLAINVISFYNGTAVSFLIVYSLQILEVFLIMNFGNLDIVKWFPLSSLTISSQYKLFNYFDLYYNVFWVFICLLFSFLQVKKIDLSLVKHN